MIAYVDKAFVEYGADNNSYEPGSRGEGHHPEGLQRGAQDPPRPYTAYRDGCFPEVLNNMYEDLLQKCDILMNTFVEDIIVESGRAVGIRLADGTERRGEYVIAAPGREGASWLAGVVEKLNIPIASMPVDIGVRVEVPDSVCEDLTQHFYE